MKFFIPTKKLFKASLVAIFVLLLMNILSNYLDISSQENRPLKLLIIRLFDFNQEANIPSFFSSLLFLAASFLLLFITVYKKSRKRKYWGWLGLTILFFFLTLDEAVSIHEFLIGFFRKKLNLSGYLYYAWVIPYGITLIILGLVYIPFFRNLNSKLFFLMMLSAGLYLSGAIGFEMLGGKSFEVNGLSFTYRVLYTMEETLEMIGLAVFIYTLNWYISIKRQKVSIVLME